MRNFYVVEITGKDSKRLLRTLSLHKIEMESIIEEPKKVILCLSPQGYQKLLEIKTIDTIRVIGYRGPWKFLYWIRMYRLFLCAFSLSLLLIFFLSHLIFSVEVVHTKESIRSLVREELKKEGIDRYHWIRSFDDQERIVKTIIERNRDQIEWLEIERIGTKYIAKVEERKRNSEEKSETPRDIVARKEGRILEIEAAQGTIVAAKDQYVKKGDILISGQIKNKDTVMALVEAQGKVYATTWYTIDVSLPYHYEEKTKTGRKKKTLVIDFFGKSWHWFDRHPYEKKESHPLFEIKNSFLPIRIAWEEEEEVEQIEKIYTKDLALVEASMIAREKLLSSLGEDASILYEKSLKITEEDSKIEIEIFFTVKENITAYQEIKEEPQKEGN